MDESVLRAMAKWPRVPAVYGWLALDRRGRWWLRGEVLEHPRALEFIGRNYARDARGCWYFQNGPQRVFVALEYTPWICRVAGEADLVTHTGRAVREVDGAWLDESGALVLATEHGPALLDERDLPALGDRFDCGAGGGADEDAIALAAERLAAGAPADLRLDWSGVSIRVGSMLSGDVPRRFGYVRDPAPEADDAGGDGSGG